MTPLDFDDRPSPTERVKPARTAHGAPRVRTALRPNRLAPLLFALLAALAVVVAFGTARGHEDTGSTGRSLLETIEAHPELSIFAEILAASGLGERLATTGTLTVFAPSNAAFAGFDEAELRALADNPGTLNFVLRHHMVNGAIPAAALGRSPTFSTLQGSELLVDAYGSAIRISGARVLATDLRATNGVVHIVGGLLTPRADFPNKNQSSIPLGGSGAGTGRTSN